MKMKLSLEKLSGLMTSICGFVCETFLVILVLMVSFEVLSRNLFGVSFSGVEILSGYVLVLLTFLGGAVALQAGSVYRMSVVDGKLRPATASLVAIVVHLFAIVFLGFIAYYAGRLAISSFERGVTSQANSSIQLWWLQVAIPFGAAAMIFVLTPGLIRNLSVVISNVNRLIQTSQGQKK